MDIQNAVAALGALAQDTRLAAFRLLVRHEPDGLPAGEVARRLDVPQNTMSTHLAALAAVGLALPERQGRTIIYRAGLARFGETVRFLLKDCCGGRAELYGPLIDSLLPAARGRSAVRRRIAKLRA